MGNLSVNVNSKAAAPSVSYKFEYTASLLGLTVPQAQKLLKDFSLMNNFQGLASEFAEYRRQAPDSVIIDVIKSFKDGNISSEKIELTREAQKAGIPYSELKHVYTIGDVKKYLQMKKNGTYFQLYTKETAANLENDQKKGLNYLG